LPILGTIPTFASKDWGKILIRGGCWIARWTDESANEWMHAWACEWIDNSLDEGIDQYIVTWLDGWVAGRLNGCWVNGMDRWRTEQWIDGLNEENLRAVKDFLTARYLLVWWYWPTFWRSAVVCSYFRLMVLAHDSGHTVVSVTPAICSAHPLSDLLPQVEHNNTRCRILTCLNFNVVFVSGISPALHMESI
jgi:hypothetical protein